MAANQRVSMMGREIRHALGIIILTALLNSSVAYVAFPLALHVLNTHLSASTARHTPSSKTLIEVMTTMHSQYDGVHWVAKLVRQLVELVQNDSTLSAGQGVASWADLLTFKPRTYLRLALAMDLGMSSGRIPDQKDFPARLDMNVLRSLTDPHTTGRVHEVPEGLAAVKSTTDAIVEDSALGVDFFDVNVPSTISPPRNNEGLDTRGVNGEQSTGVNTVPEDMPRRDGQEEQGNFDTEMGGLDDIGSLPDHMDDFFDPVLADLARGAEDGNPATDISGAFEADIDTAIALAI